MIEIDDTREAGKVLLLVLISTILVVSGPLMLVYGNADNQTVDVCSLDTSDVPNMYDDDRVKRVGDLPAYQQEMINRSIISHPDRFFSGDMNHEEYKFSADRNIGEQSSYAIVDVDGARVIVTIECTDGLSDDREGAITAGVMLFGLGVLGFVLLY